MSPSLREQTLAGENQIVHFHRKGDTYGKRGDGGDLREKTGLGLVIVIQLGLFWEITDIQF